MSQIDGLSRSVLEYNISVWLTHAVWISKCFGSLGVYTFYVKLVLEMTRTLTMFRLHIWSGCNEILRLKRNMFSFGDNYLKILQLS